MEHAAVTFLLEVTSNLVVLSEAKPFSTVLYFVTMKASKLRRVKSDGYLINYGVASGVGVGQSFIDDNAEMKRDEKKKKRKSWQEPFDKVKKVMDDHGETMKEASRDVKEASQNVKDACKDVKDACKSIVELGRELIHASSFAAMLIISVYTVLFVASLPNASPSPSSIYLEIAANMVILCVTFDVFVPIREIFL